MDDTLALVQMGNRGLALDNEFRYWFSQQKGQLDTAYINDAVSKSERYRFVWSASQQMPNQWNLNWSLQDVSDEAFYREIQLTNRFLRYQLYLPRTISLAKSWDQQSLSINFQDFKKLLYGQPYYASIPSIHYQYKYAPQQSIFFTSINTEFNHFAIPEARSSFPVGNRIHLTPSVGFDLWKPYGFLRGKTQLLMTQYDLSDNSDNALTRVLPLVSLDAGLSFEKPVSWFNNRYLHTLEPRMKYLYVGTQDQSQFPIFDTMLRNFDYLQLFTDNRFTGLDRIGDSNQVTTGLFSRLLRDNGKEFLEFGLGQISYFQDRKVQLPTDINRTNTVIDNTDFSDIIATASLINGPWRLNLTQQLDRNSKTMVQEDASIQYVNSQDDRFILRHRLRNRSTTPEDEQTTVGGKLRYNGEFSSLHFVNYNNTTEQVRSSLHAIQYDSCCWASQLIWEKNQYINQVQDDIIRFAFIFKGLTTFGSKADNRVDSRLYFE